MKGFLKWFEFNRDVKTYKFPILKICVCSLVMLLLIAIFPVRKALSSFWDDAIGVLSALVGFLCIFCIALSFCEIISVSENREIEKLDKKTALAKSKTFLLDDVLSLLKSNDIIDILIFSNEQFIKIGSSSESVRGSSRFFNKRYYLGDEEFESFEDFSEILRSHSQNDSLCVVTIDGLPVTKKKRKQERS